DTVAFLSSEMIHFFQPPQPAKSVAQTTLADSVSDFWKSASNSDLTGSLQKALNSAAKPGMALLHKASESSLLLAHKSSSEQLRPESPAQPDPVISSSISQHDLDIILDVAFTAIEELFSLSEGEQWLRQQSLHLIKVVLKRTFSQRLSRAIASKVDAVSSQPMATQTLTSLSNTLWPDGRGWGTGPAPAVRTPHEINRTKHQLFCVMTAQEGMKKSKEFESVFSSIKNVVGAQNAQKGILRGFFLVQNDQLTAGLFCEVFEILVNFVTNN
ncbi:sorting nexin 13, partial [Kappamyces sp. JEL0680]